MRILFVAQELPFPPTNGRRWKLFLLLKTISKDCECGLIAFMDLEQEAQLDRFLRECPRVTVIGAYRERASTSMNRVAGMLRFGLPSAGRFWSPDVAALIRRVTKDSKYDVAHIDMINMAPYLEALEDLPVVLSVNDAVSLGYIRWAEAAPSRWQRLTKRFAAWLIRRYERHAYPRANAVHVVSPVDKAYLERACRGALIEVIELPVDDEYLADVGATDDAPMSVVVPVHYADPTLRHHLLRFLRTGFPRVRERFPEVTLHVVGRPSPECGQLEAFAGVHHVGWVENYKGTLARATVVMFVDNGGAGTKNRVLQAMALGRATVMPAVAARGVSAEDARQCLVADTPYDATAALNRLLSDPCLARRLGRAARALVQERHASAVVGQKWRDLYLRIARGEKAHCPAGAQGIRTQQ